jgi:hypothetical protein
MAAEGRIEPFGGHDPNGRSWWRSTPSKILQRCNTRRCDGDEPSHPLRNTATVQHRDHVPNSPLRQQPHHFRHRIAKDDPSGPTSTDFQIDKMTPVGRVPHPATGAESAHSRTCPSFRPQGSGEFCQPRDRTWCAMPRRAAFCDVVGRLVRTTHGDVAIVRVHRRLRAG